MPVESRNRAMGYIKGMQGYDLRLSVEPEEHYISADTGRATIPTKTVDLEVIKKWAEALSTPIYMSDVVPVGQVVIVDHGALPYHYGAYLHPTDYYWVKHKDNPELAHRLVESWMDQRLESMVRAAEARLDAMVEEMEYKAAHKEAMDRYKGQLKYYFDTSDSSPMVFMPFASDGEGRWHEIVEEGERVHQACDEEIHRDRDRMDSILHSVISYQEYSSNDNGDRYFGFPDSWALRHPRVVEPKTSIFDPKNGAT